MLIWHPALPCDDSPARGRGRWWADRKVAGARVQDVLPAPEWWRLADWLDVSLPGNVSAARRARWGARVAIAVGLRAVRDRARRGAKVRAMLRLLALLPRELYLRRPARSTAWRWVADFESRGPLALLDGRGGPGRAKPRRRVDAALREEFQRAVASGVSPREAYVACRERAEREGRPWFSSLDSSYSALGRRRPVRMLA